MKENCEYPSIPRGKFCEMHRTNKRRIAPSSVPPVSPSIPHEKILEDRFLREEQMEEYERTVEEDRRRIRELEEQKELEMVIELSKKMELDEKRKKIITEPVDNYFNVQIIFPNGRKARRKFEDASRLSDIRNFVDVYLIDNEIKIENYDLVHNYPFMKFTFSENDEPLATTFSQKNFSLYIQNLDS